MRGKIFLFVILMGVLSISNVDAQDILGGLKKKVKKKVERKVEKNVDDAIDDGLNEAEKEIKEGGDDEEETTDQQENESTTEDKDQIDKSPNVKDQDMDPTKSEKDATQSKELKVWSKYDFVPGDKIIFEDNLDGEQIGEFPSRWDLVSGNIENAKLGEENVISFVKNKSEINPYMDVEEYLPQIFTIEFDIYFYKKYNEAYHLNFKDMKPIDIRTNKVSFGKFSGEPGEGARDVGWHHVAISFNKRALKVYFDQTRVLNIPRIKTPPTSFTISALSHGAKKGDPAIIKSIRVAEGGVKLYDRILADGKFVTRGILFDVNKSIIKPESMGVINQIVKLMNDHTDLNFSIQGHTDSDGKEEFNLELSRGRAKAVKSKLVELGIDDSRLQTEGFGESKPVDNNATAEGKANNRRVEFIKI